MDCSIVIATATVGEEGGPGIRIGTEVSQFYFGKNGSGEQKKC